LVIDAAGVDAWTPLANALAYRAENGWIRETYVGGRCVRTREQSAPAQAFEAIGRLLPSLHL